jgi:hypothetical protein
MPKEIKCDVLKVIDTAELHGGNKVQIRIVTWNGKNPMLEKRELWTDEEGNEKMGKAKGFTLEELTKIVENFDEIEKIMEKKIK